MDTVYRRKILSGVVMIGFISATDTVSATDASVFEGAGTADDPYVIESAEQLQAVSDELDAHYELGADLDGGELESFEPIGDRRSPFTGSFDGAGYVISNLQIDAAESVGLFGVLSGGHVHRVTLEDVSVTGSDEVGALVGYNNDGTIEQSSVTGQINAEMVGGGLVGYNDGSIVDSYVVGEVYAEVGGGIAGDNDGSISATYTAVPISDEWVSPTTTAGHDDVENSYWDSVVGAETNFWVDTWLLTPDMTGSGAESTMADFDFDETWETTSSYPRLAFQETSPPTPDATAAFAITDVEPDSPTITAGESVSVEVTVHNRGDRSDTQTVRLEFDGDEHDTATLSLDADETQSVSFDPIETDDLLDSEYDYEVQTEHDRLEQTVSVGEGELDGDVTLDADEPELPQAEDAVLAGETTLPDGAELSIRLRGEMFVHNDDVTVDGSEWESTLDLSYLPVDTEFEITVSSRDETHVETTGVIVDPADVADEPDDDEPELEDEEFIVLDRAQEPFETVAAVEDSEWVGSIPTVPEADNISLGAKAQLEDGEILEPGRGYELAAEELTDGDEPLLEIESYVDHVHLTGVWGGESEVVFAIQADGDVVYETPPVTVGVEGAEPPSTADEQPADDAVDEDDDATDDDVADDTAEASEGDDEHADEVGDEEHADGEGDTREDESASTDSEETDDVTAEIDADDIPGFTGVGALAGLGAIGYCLRRRLGTDSTASE